MSRRGLIGSDSSVESTRNLRSPISHVTSPREFVRCDVSATSGHVTVSSSLTSPASSQHRHNPRVASPYPGHSAPPSRRQPRRQNPSTNPPATSNQQNAASDATTANNLQGSAQPCYPAASGAPAAPAASSVASSPRHGVSVTYQNLQSPTPTFYQKIQSPTSASSSSLADVDCSPRRFSPSSMSTPRSQTTSVVSSVGGCPSGDVDPQSQEYVDEKLAEFQAAIQHLQDEQERVQKKTFLNWINSYLVKCNPSVQLRSLIADLRDGTKLLLLLQILSGEKLCMERGRVLKRPHFISNVRTALQFLQTRNIKLVNINPSDIVDGRPAVVLGLVWTIILYFQIEENTRVLDKSGLSSDTSSGSNRSTHRPGARLALLNWARTAACGVPVADFGPSWRDGKAFVAIVHCINPTVINVPTTDLMSVTDRLNTAFQVAETSLGIARLLDPEDVDVPNPEEKSIMTYVAQFLHKYPEPRNAAVNALDSVQYQVQVMKEWLGRTIHAISNMSSKDTHNFNAFKLVKNETSSRYVKYEQMKSSHSTDPSCWDQMDSHWKTLQHLLSEWQCSLDECVPACLLPLVRFLARAEILLDCESSDLTSGQSVTALMQQHQECFGELPMLETLLSEFSRSAAAGELPAEQLQHLHQRLRAVQQLADQRWSQLHQLHQQDLWSVYVDSYTCVVSWLDDVDLLVNELPRNLQQIERHLSAVSSRPEHLLSAVRENAQAVCESVCDSRRARVIDELTELDTRWQAGVEAAAAHGRTVQLVAQLLEADRHVSDAETNLSAAEQQSRDSDDAVPQLLAAASQLLADIRDACDSASCPDDRILTPASRLQQRLEKLHLRFISLSDRVREDTSQRRIFKTRLCTVQSWMDCADRCVSADILDPACTRQQINSVTDQRANLLADLNAQKESISWLLTSCEPSQLEQIHQLSDSFHQLASQLQLVAESAPACLSYRVEVEEILRLVFAARDECSATPAVWHNVQQLTGAVQMFRGCWERLQQLQLPDLVCRGRQLSTRSRHTEQLVEKLESSWQSVQTAVTQQLQETTETEQLWRYVLDGVEQLEAAVSDDQLVLTSSQSVAEPSKQLLQLSGCRSQQLPAEKLEQLVLQLVPRISPPAAEQLQVRMAGCASQVQNVGELLLQRRETLTVADQLFRQAEERVERLKQQLETAEKSCNYPDEQLQQLNQDHQQLVDLTDQLRTSGFGVSRIRDDVDCLREALDRLKTDVHQLREFERLAGELRQWLKQAEELVSAGIAAADDTEQLVADVDCWRNLKQLADGQEELVKGVVAAGRGVSQLEAREEADSLACRWSKVRSGAGETLQKLETRLCRVQQLQHDVQMLEQWLNSCKDVTDGSSADAEDQLSGVDRVLSECCDQQVAAEELVRRCDDAVGALSHVGTDQLRARAVQLNSAVSDRFHQLQLLQTATGQLQTALEAARSAVVNATGVCDHRVNADNLRENAAAGVGAQEQLATALSQLQDAQAGGGVLSAGAGAAMSDCTALAARLETLLEHWRSAAALCDWCRAAGDWAVDAAAELQNSAAWNSSVAECMSRLQRLRAELSQRRQQAAEMIEQNQQILQLLPVESGVQRLLNTTDKQLQQLDSHLVAACESTAELAELDSSVADSLISCAGQLTAARQRVANTDEMSTEQRLRSGLETDRQLQGTGQQLHDIEKRVKKLREAGVDVSEHEKDLQPLLSRCKSCRTQVQRLSEQLISTLFAQLQTDLQTAEQLGRLMQQRLDSCPSDAAVLKSISDGLLQLGSACEKSSASCQQLSDLLPAEQLAEISAATRQLMEQRQLLENQRDGLTDKNQKLQDALCKFDQIRSSLDSSLTELEQHVGSLSSPALLEQLSARVKSAGALSSSVQQLVPSLTGLLELQRHISDLTPDPATHSCCQLLRARHEAVMTSSAQLADKLASLNESANVYQRALQSTRDWVAATGEQAACLTDPGEGTDWRRDGQLQLTALIGPTEQLVAGLAGESREAVRGEVRALRSEVQDVCDRACGAMRQLQEQARIRADLQRSLEQLSSWISAAEEQLQSCADSRPETLAQCQIRLSDVAALVQQAEDRRAVVSELQNSLVSCVDEVARFSALQRTADGLLARFQEDVSAQQARDSSIQTLRNWLNSQRQQLVAAQHESDEAARQTTFSCLHSSLQSGQQRVAALAAACGDSPDPRITELQTDLDALTADLTVAQKQLHSAQQKRDKQAQQLLQLQQRLQQLRDERLPLVDTTEQKRAQVEEVKDRVQGLQQMRSELQEFPAAGDLQQCYQQTHKLLTKQLLQLQQTAADHEQFDREAETLRGWLDTAGDQLQEEGSLTGNESELEARRAALEELTDEWARRALTLRQTAALSEKLSPHTGTAGRERVRECCGQLQSRAQVFSGLLQGASAEHEDCRRQRCDLTAAHKQLAGWLQQMETAVGGERSPLPTTLHEKQLQLQSHSTLHGQIEVHEDQMTDLCSRTQQLVQLTRDDALNDAANLLQSRYNQLQRWSQKLLEQLQLSVENHENLQTACSALRNLINAERQNITSLEDVSGEQQHVKTRLEQLQQLLERLPSHSQQQLAALHAKLSHAAATSSAQGAQLLTAEVQQLEDQLQQLVAQADAVKKRLTNSSERWARFQLQYGELLDFNKLQKGRIAAAKQLRDSLPEKQETLDGLEQVRQTLSARESDVDRFIELANSLTDKPAAQARKLAADYQELLSACHSACSCWQQQVEEHREYDEKYHEADRWLSAADVSSEEKIPAGQMLVHSVSSIGERLLGNTAAGGRQRVRQQLTDIKKRWENLQERVRTLRQQEMAKREAEVNAGGVIQQLSCWLQEADAVVAAGPDSWNSVAHIKARIFRLKELMADSKSPCDKLKAAQGSADQLPEDVRSQLQQLGQRLDSVLGAAGRNTTVQECLCSHLTTHQQLLSDHRDWAAAGRVKLDSISAPMSEHSDLAQSLNQCSELEQQLEAGPDSWAAVTSQVQQLRQLLPDAAAAELDEIMAREAAGVKQLLEDALKARSDISKRLSQWTECEAALQTETGRVEEAELLISSLSVLKNSLDEKRQQLKSLQELSRDLTDQHQRLLDLSSTVHDLLKTSPDSRVLHSLKHVLKQSADVRAVCQDLLPDRERFVKQHEQYVKVYDSCVTDESSQRRRLSELQLPAVLPTAITTGLTLVRELRSASVSPRVAAVQQMADDLYTSTAADGCQLVREQLQQLQNSCDELLQQLTDAEVELCAAKKSQFEYDRLKNKLKTSLTEMSQLLSTPLPLRATLDEKSDELQSLRTRHGEVAALEEVLAECREKSVALQDPDKEYLQQSSDLLQQLVAKTRSDVERYEEVVGDHQRYSGAVMAVQEYQESTQCTLDLWSSPRGELEGLNASLHKLQQLEADMEEEEARVELVQTLGEKVLPNTSADGQENVRAQLETTRQEWETLKAGVGAALTSVQRMLDQWNRFLQMKSDWTSWLDRAESMMRDVAPRCSLQEKQQQLQQLATLQDEVDGHQLEIDTLTDGSQELTSRQSKMSDIIQRYQRLAGRVTAAVQTWTRYVAVHTEYMQRYQHTDEWLQGCTARLSDCCDPSFSTQHELEENITAVKRLMVDKEEGLRLVRSTSDLGQTVMTDTTPVGHEVINGQVSEITRRWEELVAKVAGAKVKLDELQLRWAGFLEEVQKLEKMLSDLSSQLKDAEALQTSMSSKRLQIDRLKALKERVNSERSDLEALELKTAELCSSSGDTPSTTHALQLLGRYQQEAQRVDQLLHEREQQYGDHRSWRQALDDFHYWISSVGDKRPSTRQRSLADRVSLETSIAALDCVLQERPAGDQKLQLVVQAGDQLLAGSSEEARREIEQQLAAAQLQLQEFFDDVERQRNGLQTMETQMRQFKEQHERLSDWLQTADAQLKQLKSTDVATELQTRQLTDSVQQLCDSLEEGSCAIDLLEQSAGDLLSSHHVETYIVQQLRSRYQVQVNLCRDQLQRLTAVGQLYEQLAAAINSADSWIREARDKIRSCIDVEPHDSKTLLQQHLSTIQELVRDRDTGESLVQRAAGLWERLQRPGSRGSGGDDEAARSAVKRLHADWDALCAELGRARVCVESHLQRCRDARDIYNQLRQAVGDRQRRLQQLVAASRRPADLRCSVTEKKDIVNKYNVMLQDLSSMEPRVSASVAMCGIHGGRELGSEFEQLCREVHQLHDRQLQLLGQQEAFLEAAGVFQQWLHAARESRRRCERPADDVSRLHSRIISLTGLEAGLEEGEAALHTALQLAQSACLSAEDPDDREVVEEHVAKLQCMMDDYKDSLAAARQLLDAAAMTWTGYESQLRDCQCWIADKQQQITSLDHLQRDLPQKQAAVESLQSVLTEVFDHQSAVDALRRCAGVLLESCSDSRVSGSVTQLCADYSALQSNVRDAFRRLEVAHMDHMQHWSVCQEAAEWVRRTTEQLTETEPAAMSSESRSELLDKLVAVQQLQSSLEHGAQKLRSVMDMKDSVLSTTTEDGAVIISSECDSLQQSFNQLSSNIGDRRNRLQELISASDSRLKAAQRLAEILDDVEFKAGDLTGKLNSPELAAKKSALTRYNSLLTELDSSAGDIVSKLRSSTSPDGLPMDTGDSPAAYSSPGGLPEDVVIRHDRIHAGLQSAVKRLQRRVAAQLRYLAAAEAAREWLRKAWEGAQPARSLQEPVEALELKREAVRAVLQSLAQGGQLAQRVRAESVALKQDSGDVTVGYVVEADDAVDASEDVVDSDVKAIQDEFDRLCDDSRASEESLTDVLKRWSDAVEKRQKLEAWLDANDRQIQSITADDEADAAEVKSLHTAISEGRSDVDGVCELWDLLSDSTGQLEAGSLTAGLRDRHAAQLQLLEEVIARLEKQLVVRRVEAARQEFLRWLEAGRSCLEECQPVDCAAEQLERNRQRLVQLLEGLVEGKRLLDDAVVDFNHDTTDEGDSQFQYGQFSSDIQRALQQVEEQQQLLQQTQEQVSDLERWLAEVELDVSKPIVSGEADVAAIRGQLDAWAELERRLQARRPELNSLQQRHLFELRVTALVDRWQQCTCQCNRAATALRTRLTEQDEYNRLLNEVQKWLLETSHQLFVSSSQLISDRPQTQQALERHEQVQAQIDGFRERLAELERAAERHPELATPTTDGSTNQRADETDAVRKQTNRQLANIRDSYDSVKSTAQRIDKRLRESLDKFQQHESILSDVDGRLNRARDTLAASPESYSCLEAVTARLDALESVQEQLVADKLQVEAAAQLCESARAAVSRPASPLDREITQLPQLELQVRCRLEQLVDQCQTQLSRLRRLEAGVKQLETRAGQLVDWVEERKTQLEQLGSAPVRPRAVQRVQEVQQDVTQQLQDLQLVETEFRKLLTDAPQLRVRQLLQQLQTQASDTLKFLDSSQKRVKDHQSSMDSLNSWIKLTADELKRVDVESRDIESWSSSVSTLLQSCEQHKPLLQRLQGSAGSVQQLLGNPEEQQAEEVAGRFRQLHQLVTQRLQHLQSAGDQLTAVTSQILELSESSQDALQRLTTEVAPLGYLPEPVSKQLQNALTIQTSISSKQQLLPQLVKSVESLRDQLPRQQHSDLASSLQQLQKRMKTLEEVVRERAAFLQNSLTSRLDFQQAHGAVEQRLKAVDVQDAPLQLPLTVDEVHGMVLHADRVVTDLDVVLERDLADVEKLAASVRPGCSADHLHQMDRIVSSLRDAASLRRDEMTRRRDRLRELEESRSRFLQELDSCRTWLDSTQSSLKQIPLSVTTLTLMQQHALRMNELRSEFNDRNQLLAGVLQQGQQLLPQLRAQDHQLVSEQLTTVEAQYGKMGARIERRCEAFRSAVSQQERISQKVTSSISYLAEIRTEISSLNRPLGADIEDAQTLLASYEDVLKKLRDFKKQLDVLRTQTMEGMTELNELVRQQDQLMSAIEAQVQRLRQLVITRQQYMQLTVEITSLLATSCDEASCLEQEQLPAVRKLERFDELLSRIEHVETLLEETRQLEGRMEQQGDGVSHQLSSLQQRTSTLKRSVVDRQTHWRRTAQQTMQLLDQISQLVGKLKQRQQLLQLRPQLPSTSPAELQLLLQQVCALSADVEVELDALRQRLAEAGRLEVSAGELSDAVQQAGNLIDAVSTELTAYVQHHTDAAAALDRHRQLHAATSDWLQQLRAAVEAAADLSADSAGRLQRAESALSERQSRAQQLNELSQSVRRVTAILATSAGQKVNHQHRQLTDAVTAALDRLQQLRDAADRQLASCRLAHQLIQQLQLVLQPVTAAVGRQAGSRDQLSQLLEELTKHQRNLQTNDALVTELHGVATSLQHEQLAESAAAVQLLDSWRLVSQKLQQRIDDVTRSHQLCTRLEADLAAMETLVDDVTLRLHDLSGATSVSGMESQILTLQTDSGRLSEALTRADQLRQESGRLMHMWNASDPSCPAATLSQRCEKLLVRLPELQGSVTSQLKRISGNRDAVRQYMSRASSLRNSLQTQVAHLAALDSRGDDQESRAIDSLLQNLMSDSDRLTDDVSSLRDEVNQRCSIITDIQDEMNAVESLLAHLQDLSLQRSQSLKNCVSQIDQYQQDVKSLRAEISQLDVQLRAVSQPQYICQQPQTALTQQQEYQQRLRDLRTAVSVRVRRVREMLQRARPDPSPLPPVPR